MKGKRFSEEQIIGVLNEAEQTGNIREVCRRHNISEQTFYRWRTKFGGMDVSEARRLKELERENAELKKMVADLSLDNRMLKELNTKKMVSLAERRRAAEHLESKLGVSERRACQVVGIARSTKRRPSGRIEEAKLVRRVHELTERYPRFGYRKIHAVLRSDLNDFHVSYQINLYTREANRMATILSELNQNIRDAFAEGGVEILSPAYAALRDGGSSTVASHEAPSGG